MQHNYPASVVTANDRAMYDDAFGEGEFDNAQGSIRNNYEPGSAGWLGYKAGVASFQPVRENWEAQAHYDARWGGEPFDPMAEC